MHLCIHHRPKRGLYISITLAIQHCSMQTHIPRVRVSAECRMILGAIWNPHEKSTKLLPYVDSLNQRERGYQKGAEHRIGPS